MEAVAGSSETDFVCGQLRCAGLPCERNSYSFAMEKTFTDFGGNGWRTVFLHVGDQGSIPLEPCRSSESWQHQRDFLLTTHDTLWTVLPPDLQNLGNDVLKQKGEKRQRTMQCKTMTCKYEKVAMQQHSPDAELEILPCQRTAKKDMRFGCPALHFSHVSKSAK